MKGSRQLALGKKRRDNYLVEAMLLLRGEVAAAINADRCQERMFRMAERQGGKVPDEVYQAGIASCDELQPVLDECREALKAYRARTDQARRTLEALDEEA